METQAVTGLVQYGALGIFCLALVGAVVALWHALTRKEDAHRAERKEDREAHLGALDKLGMRVDVAAAAVRDVQAAHAETSHQLERLADRLPLVRATGSATIATLLYLVLVGVWLALATSCTRRVDTVAQVRATLDEQHQAKAADHELEERKRHVVERSHSVSAPYVAPGAPAPRDAYVVTTDSTRTEDEGILLDLMHIDAQLDAQHGAASADVTEHDETRAGLPFGLVAALAGGVLLAVAVPFVAAAGGPGKAVAIAVRFVSRMFNRGGTT